MKMSDMDLVWETTSCFPMVYYQQGTYEEQRNSHKRAIGSMSPEAHIDYGFPRRRIINQMVRSRKNTGKRGAYH